MAKKNKTLLELLNELDPDEVVYLGTINGSSLIAIETASDMIEKLGKIEKVVHGNAVKFLTGAKRRLNVIPGRIVSIQEELKTEKDEKARNKLLTKLENYERSYVSSYHMRLKYIPTLENWKTMDERIVKKTYPHTTDIPGITVLVEGFDDGTLWFKGERRGSGKEDV